MNQDEFEHIVTVARAGPHIITILDSTTQLSTQDIQNVITTLDTLQQHLKRVRIQILAAMTFGNGA